LRLQKPKPLPKRRDPNNKFNLALSKRTRQNLTPDMLIRRDAFIHCLLLGRSRYESAILSGVSKLRARREASTMYHEPYVQERLRELREKMQAADLLTKNELILNVKSIATDEEEKGDARVKASKLLSDIMGFNAPIKIENGFSGGVMVVPLASTPEEWEEQAKASQAKLKEDVTL
jgi:hypothetical protein